MGPKRTKTPTKNVDKLVPPGFASLTSFRLRKRASSELVPEGDPIHSTFDDIDISSLKKSLCRRPWILDCQHKQNQEEYDSDQVLTAVSQDLPARSTLPRGITRGCPDCSNCLKVMAGWCPENAIKDVIEEVPVFYPNEKEFGDAPSYIASIHPVVEEYGICRIIPPPSWNPPLLMQKDIWETSSFATQVQRIDGLQIHYIQGNEARTFENESGKRTCSFRTELEHRIANGCTGDLDQTGCSEVKGFVSENGPEFTLATFQKYALDFKSQYFSGRSINTDYTMHNERWEPSLDDIEGEYRRIVENPTEEIEVLYYDDLSRRVFGAEFPTKSSFSKISDDHDYLNSGWNLQNTPRLPGSLLSFESFETSGVLAPKLRIGMCFSSFGWKVEEHHLYLLCYMHLGAPKIWYGIPGRHRVKFEAVVKKHLPDLIVEQPKLWDGKFSKLSLSTLKSEGIPVFRCIQNPGEFVLVLAGAYYSGFDSGFNCAEAVNVAPIDWLPHGQHAVELYCRKGRKTAISHDKLLLGAAREAVRAQWEVSLRKNTLDNTRWVDACGKDSILAKALKSRIQLEGNRREYLCTSSQSRRMDQNFDAMTKRECSICFYDLHLSAVQCQCSADRYSCLNHSKQLCSCGWTEKIFLFRYEIKELNSLLEALGKKLTAVYRCARVVLELSIFSSLSDVSSQKPSVMVDPVSQEEESEEHEDMFCHVSTASRISGIRRRRSFSRQVPLMCRPQEKEDTSHHAATAGSISSIRRKK